ncbi:hypothetical protein [Parasedimentitalea psychrophila]|uniref:Uncharacterized protein n=1 Tax=Parasedimentitalea psychrophila TaxID=2997337 RepID=A0A9Y2KZ46_9RHOB|nr:hypothetical protein [Parasedimentitalea psychrophila]WIY25781.1 hypothetical protein QPJ95_02230 [Parasedimentitalea psychrophila]
MKRFIEGDDREQGVLFSAHLEGFVSDDNPVRAVDAFVDALDLVDIGFTALPRQDGPVTIPLEH